MYESDGLIAHDGQLPGLQAKSLEDLPDYPDLVLEDGRRLQFYRNIDAESGTSETGHAGDANECHIFNRLGELGVVELPEVIATDRAGRPIAGYQAVYVDDRIGKARLDGLVLKGTNGGWLVKNDPRLRGSRGLEERVSPQEINALVDRGVEETGLAAQVAAIKEEDSRRIAAMGPLDLQAILRATRDQLK